MNNPFWKNSTFRLLYAAIWVVITLIQILLLGYYFTGIVYLPSVLYDSLVCNSLQAGCLLVLWYPIQYYRNIVSVFLFVVYHLLLFIISSAIWLGAGYFITQAVFDPQPFYTEFFLHLLPVRLFSGLLVYILFVMAYYLFLTNSTVKEQKEVIEETATEAIVPPEEKLSRISVKKHREIRFIPVDQIHCIEADGDYVMIYTDKDKYLKDKTMKYWETHLPDDLFVRIHRSFIVNIEWIAKIELYEKETYKVQLKNGSSLKASNAGYRLLKQKMQL
ncbi:MAG: LytTR family transcriptional regulator [Dysgonamonadaceae bacterium]|jgi:hypothetical protein|nr:LytTR family transcriptional regulator [Dysgonamonadaceae bacterium]